MVLGLSRTVPTIIFRPSQIRRINDNLADGSSEKTEFDDQDLEWPELHDARRPNVMNDVRFAMSFIKNTVS